MELTESHVDASEAEESIFDGIDTTISGIAGFEADADADFTRFLADLERSGADALALYDPLKPLPMT